jgi:hypothetical protein
MSKPMRRGLMIVQGAMTIISLSRSWHAGESRGDFRDSPVLHIPISCFPDKTGLVRSPGDGQLRDLVFRSVIKSEPHPHRSPATAVISDMGDSLAK